MDKTNLVAELGRQEIVITRAFHAPRELVFKTMTDPALIPHWWGPSGYTTVVEAMDPRMGGIWRFVQSDSGGITYAFHGVYHEVIAPERLVYTYEYEGTPGQVLLEVVTFEEHLTKTEVIQKMIFQSVQDRDGMFQSGMQEGVAESMDRFAELLKTQ